MGSWAFSRDFHQVSITLGSNPSQQAFNTCKKIAEAGYILWESYGKKHTMN